jgi:hypothetical protein
MTQRSLGRPDGVLRPCDRQRPSNILQLLAELQRGNLAQDNSKRFRYDDDASTRQLVFDLASEVRYHTGKSYCLSVSMYNSACRTIGVHLAARECLPWLPAMLK